MAVVDDNLLLLLHPKNTLYPALYHDPSNSTYVALYVGVTESISINLEATVAILTERIWPSDGFVIRYYVNDFTKVNSTDNTYHVYFDSKNHSIAFVIELSTTHDTCNCNELSYKCNSCAHHVELSNHLSVADNVMDKLSFNINYYMNDLDVLFLPSQLTIMLQRCIINFTLSEVTVYESFIDFEFHLSPNCFSRVGSTFSLDIVSQVIDLSETLVIHIADASQYECLLCVNDVLKLYYDTSNLNQIKFDVYITSNDIDFQVVGLPNPLLVQYFKKDAITTIWSNDWLYVSIIPLIVILIVIGYIRKIYMNAFVVDRALVFIIGCSQFDDKRSYLQGVPQNISDLKTLWRDTYNYDVFVCNGHTLYCTKTDVLRFIDFHRAKIQQKKYQAVLFHLISHGNANSFTTSDGKQIEIDFIQHELITASDEVQHFALIKLIFHHGCQGESSYHTR
eukprot:215032_1